MAQNQLWDWHGVIGTGQSLSVGVEGTPLRATAPSYRNLKLDLGNRFFPASSHTSDRLSLVPLCEPIRWLGSGYPAPYPGNLSGETPHTCMASQITALVLAAGGRDYVTVHSVVGESGQGIKAIAKGAPKVDDTGYAYEASLFEVRAISRLARAAGRSFGVSAIVLTHGETDAQNPDYEASLHRLWRDYRADLATATGQAQLPVLFATQQSSCPTERGGLATSALALLSASLAHPSHIVCVAPRYQYEYSPDAVHLNALSYDRLGEKYGQIYFERLVRGVDWRPLAPRMLERHDDGLAVVFDVPVAPLVWDESLPSPHALPHPWAKGRGFELVVDGQPAPIDSVEIAGERVLVRSASARGSGRIELRYATTAAAAPRPGGTWRWGQLRDSDPFVGATTRTAQPNYAVSFALQLS